MPASILVGAIAQMKAGVCRRCSRGATDRLFGYHGGVASDSKDEERRIPRSCANIPPPSNSLPLRGALREGGLV